jgi:O-antigen/teichoic acid export membrane protein
VSGEALGYNPPKVLRWVALFPYVTLGQYMIGNICQGTGRIPLLSVQQVLPYFMLLPFTALQIFVFRYYTLQVAIAAYVVAFSITLAIGFSRLGATFANWRHWLHAVARENRRTGLPIYLGGLFGTASVQVIALWVAEYVEAARYGQYALAIVVASPMAILVSSVGTVIFRSSSARTSLSPRILVFAFGLGAVLGAAYLLATETLLVRIFGSEYGLSVRMAQALGLSSLMIGWGDIFQRFLGAQGQGRRLGLVSVSTGTVGVASAAYLLPRYDAYGAIVSSILAAGTYLGLLLVLYRHHTTKARGEAVAS